MPPRDSSWAWLIRMSASAMRTGRALQISASRLPRAARLEPGDVPARDLFEPGRAHRLADLYESPWHLDAVGDSGRCAKGRRVRVQQLEIGVLAVEVQPGIGRVLADGRPLLQRS